VKVRLGFVSNSSSSSFCLYGVSIDYDNTVISDDKVEDLAEYIDDLANKLNLEWACGISYYSDEFFIGLCPDTIFKRYPNKTITEIKGIIANIFKENNISGSPKWYVDGGYNG
jgi:hypothetical protein